MGLFCVPAPVFSSRTAFGWRAPEIPEIGYSDLRFRFPRLERRSRPLAGDPEIDLQNF